MIPKRKHYLCQILPNSDYGKVGGNIVWGDSREIYYIPRKGLRLSFCTYQLPGQIRCLFTENMQSPSSRACKNGFNINNRTPIACERGMKVGEMAGIFLPTELFKNKGDKILKSVPKIL